MNLYSTKKLKCIEISEIFLNSPNTTNDDRAWNSLQYEVWEGSIYTVLF